MSTMLIQVKGYGASGGTEQYYFQVDDNGYPAETIKKLVEGAYKNFSTVRTELLSDIVLGLLNTAKAQKLNPVLNTNGILSRNDTTYCQLSSFTNNAQYVCITLNKVVGSRLRDLIYSGRLSDIFKIKANTLVAELKAKTGKLLRFNYNGGTAPGVRIIRLEDVVGNDKNVVLKGIDMAVSVNPTVGETAWRSYKLEKIDGGKIEVLN